MLPPRPPVADPVTSSTLPEFPDIAVPEDTRIFPLSPFNAALLVVTSTQPEDEDELSPDRIMMEPPAAAADVVDPPDTYTLPPSPVDAVVDPAST
jgi:hypothetical protein